MKTVWKYPIPITDFLEQVVEIEMPTGGQVLHIAEQTGDPCMWVLVDPEAPLEARIFNVYATGYHFNALCAEKPVGTVLTRGGSMVWHVFEQPL